MQKLPDIFCDVTPENRASGNDDICPGVEHSLHIRQPDPAIHLNIGFQPPSRNHLF